MPPLPAPKGAPTTNTNGQTTTNTTNTTPNTPLTGDDQGQTEVVPSKDADQYEYPPQLLKPRVIHLSIN